MDILESTNYELSTQEYPCADHWRLLEIIGDFWRSLATFGDHWRLLEVIGDFWRSLATFGGHWRLLEVIGKVIAEDRSQKRSHVFPTTRDARVTRSVSGEGACPLTPNYLRSRYPPIAMQNP